MCTDCSHLVVGFDESHNKIAQKGQMDFSVRFWNSKSNEVCVRYFGSAFLDHATAEDLLKTFTQTLNGIDLEKLLQVSMDGPNVNLKYHKDLTTYLRYDPDDPILVQIGSCGLHSLHNTFKQGMNATVWNVVQFLRVLHNLFNHVPARRADYIHSSGFNIFPLKFCAIRWLENSKVAERAVSILSNIQKYVDEIKKNKKAPACSSFKIISTAIKDKLLGPKLSFFQSLASDLEPFLRNFQSYAPLAPKLYGSLITTMRNVMSRFVKAEILNAMNDVSKLDLSNRENLISYKDVDLGYATRDVLCRAHSLKLTDRDVLEFRRNCRKAMEVLCKKLMQRSPLQFELTRGISFLDPQIAGQSSIRDKYLATTYLWNINGCQVWSQTEYSDSSKTHALQVILARLQRHSQRIKERGFSVHKEYLVENLAKESLVAQRKIYDAIIANGGLDSLTVSKPLILSTRNAHSRYIEELARRRTQTNTEKITLQERKRAAIEVKELAAKKQKLVEEAAKEATLIDAEIQTLRK